MEKIENAVSNSETLLIIQNAVRLGFEFHDTQEMQDVRYAAEEFLRKKDKLKNLKIEDRIKYGFLNEIQTQTLWLAYNFMVHSADINQQWTSDFILTFNLNTDYARKIADIEEIEIQEKDLQDCFSIIKENDK